MEYQKAKKLKLIVLRLFQLLLLPVFLAYLISSAVKNKDSAFHTTSQWVSLVPGIIGSHLRSAFLSYAAKESSGFIRVGFLTIMSHHDITIKSGVYIGPQCNIGKCEIGENTLVGSGVHILSGNRQHNFTDPTKPIQDQGGEFFKIKIGKDCWLGNGSIIMASLADQTIIAAGAVVTRPITEPMGIYAGNPAKRIKNRTAETEQ